MRRLYEQRNLWLMLGIPAAAGYLVGSGMIGASDSDATPPAVTPAAEARQAEPGASAAFTDDEARNVALFERARDAVVNINALGRQVDLFTRRVREVPRGVGSGFFWDERGHVVTNFHVIQNASGARVVLADQTTLDAELVGASPDHDLAVLKVQVTPEQAQRLPIGVSTELKVGQFVYAIGNPYGLDYTLTHGIISALDREMTAVTGRPINEAIQTDAAINPGNSGGPLLDSSGRVIGVNTAIFSPSGASAGIGFAVPIDTVARVVPQLIDKGEYTPPSLGIRISDRVSAQLLRRLDLEGVLVLGVEEDSGAADAGLRPTRRARDGGVILGDIITAIDGEPVANANDLYLILDELAAGDRVTVTLRRGEEDRDVEVELQ